MKCKPHGCLALLGILGILGVIGIAILTHRPAGNAPAASAKPAPIVNPSVRPRPPGTPAAAKKPAASASGRRLSDSALKSWRAAFTAAVPRERADIPAGEQIILQSRLIVTTHDRGDGLRTGPNRPTSRNTVPLIIQFKHPIEKATRAALVARGAAVIDYLPNRALVVEATPEVRARLASDSNIRYLAELQPADKVQPFLSYLAANAAGAVEVNIVPLSPADLPAVAAAVAAAKGNLIKADPPFVRAEIELAALDSLSREASVRWIEQRVRPHVLTDLAHNANHMDTRTLWTTWGLTGKGQIIGHSDSGIDTGDLATLHPDLIDAVLSITPLYSEDSSTGKDTLAHGTHTAGLLVGNGACSSGKYRGSAYAAKLVHEAFYTDSKGSLYSDSDNIYNIIFTDARDRGAAVQSASWGNNTSGGYDSWSLAVDQFAWDHPEFLFVAASGNSGTDTDKNGVIDTGAVGSPATAKSAVAVGAAENDRPVGSGGYSSLTWGGYNSTKYGTAPISADYVSRSADQKHQGIAAFSSRGPAADGRIKPEVVAPGTDIISTRSSASSNTGWGTVPGYDRYLFMGGTSMATPLVAGGAALLRQYAIERGGIAKPTGALIKAMLVNGARSLAPGQYGTGAAREIPDGPNVVEGWGEVDFATSVHPTNQMIRLIDDIRLANGATNAYTVAVTRAGETFAATLAWFDYPAAAGAAKTLVNDYDLELVTPSGARVYPNGLAARDSVNPLEKVIVTNAPAGTYTLRVIARECPYGSDEGGAVALAIRGSFGAAPIVVSHPRASLASVAEPLPVEFNIQSLNPLTNASDAVCLRYAPGTASAATGAWVTVPAEWLSNSCYAATLPAATNALTWHYEIIATNGVYGTGLSTSNETTVGAALQLLVSGNPSALGSPTPGYGTNSVVYGAPATLTAPLIVSDTSTVRHRCQGYVGSGDIPFYGTTNTVSYTPTQDSSITWVWLDQYLLTENRGLVFNSSYTYTTTLTSAWYDKGAAASTHHADELFYTSQGYYFALAGWTIDSTLHADNPAGAIAMSSAKTATATYYPYGQDTGGDGISDWWSLRYFNTTTNLDLEADPDGDGFSNQAEFIDDTDPHDSASHPVPPAVTLHPIDAFQTNFPPWTVTATVTDNFYVAEVQLYWQEEGDTNWYYQSMGNVSGSLFSLAFTPASYGTKRVEYCVVAYDLLGEATSYAFGTVSDHAYAIGHYSAPAAAFTPGDAQRYRFTPTATATNAAFTLQNLAGSDLVWTARLARLSQTFTTTNSGWTATNWSASTYRTEDGSPVWSCGDASTHQYANSVAAHLATPPIRVPAAGGYLVFRHWISSELASAAAKTAYDAGILSVSTDAGATWTKLVPPGGYPYTLMFTQNGLLSTGDACYAGDGSDGWQSVVLPLAAYAGQTIRLRFSFGSDSNTTAEGWYIGPVRFYAAGEGFPAWFQPTGPTNGTLAARAQANLAFTAGASGLTPHQAEQALLYLDSNASPDGSPSVPLTFELGNTLTLLAQDHGTLSPASPVFLFAPSNSPLVTASADSCYLVRSLVAIGGTNLLVQTNAATVSVQLSDLRADTTLIAAFSEFITAHNVPATWLAAHGLTNDFDAAELTDADGDSFAAWQEYLADTDPADAASALRFIGVSSNALTAVGGQAAALYFQAAPTPTGSWSTLEARLPPTAITNFFGYAPTNAARFFRIQANRP